MAGRITGTPPALDARSAALLQKVSPTGDDIWAGMEQLNEEVGAEPVAEEAQEDELDRINRELEEKLAQQRELEAARAAEASEDEPAAEAPEEMTVEDQVRKMLMDHKSAPSEAQIEAWKRQYGDDGIQVLSMGANDVYVFTYLRRASFQKIQTAMAKQAQIEGMAKDPEEFMMEQVLKQCVLWPKLSIEFFYNSRSGVIPTLYSSVMLNSYHLTPQQAMVITAQL